MIELKGKYGKDCIILTDEVEEGVTAFLYDLLDKQVSSGKQIRVMPDTHAGTGCIVGLTIPITTEVNPEWIGCDIGCGVSMISVKEKINTDLETLELINHRIRKEIPMGPSIHSRCVVEEKELFKELKKALDRGRSMWPTLIPDMEVTEKGIGQFLKRIGMDPGVFYKSLGTLGGGE